MRKPHEVIVDAGVMPSARPASPGSVAPRRRSPALLLLALCLALASTSAGAQVTASSEYLARMDRDGDGRVSLAEYQDWMSYAFDRMDANGDGVLQPEEQPGGKGKPITREEYRQRIALTFARQDRNGDGYLDARELASPPQ